MIPVEQVVFNSRNAIDIVFIAEGFQANEMPVFDQKVLDGIAAIMSYQPFSNNPNKFNFYKSPTISNESGTSVISVPLNPVTPVDVDTYWDTFKNRAGLIRYLGLTDEANLRLERELKSHFKSRVFAIFIVNDAQYLGAGEFTTSNMVNSCLVSIDNEFNVFGPLLVHEFGHSFGDLDDEYQDAQTATHLAEYEPETFYKENKPNTSNDDTVDRKWDHIDNPNYIEGSRYINTGKFRSTGDSLMRTVANGRDFSPLHKKILEDRIRDEVAYKQATFTIFQNSELPCMNVRKRNLRIHADEVTVTGATSCDELYVAVGSKLILEASLKVKSIVNRGEIIGNVEIKD